MSVLSSPLVVATANQGKMAEFRRLLGEHCGRLLSLTEAGFGGDIDEPFASYQENAVHKAVTVCSATGMSTVADDSGIEVVALDGWPGPQSARWLGPSHSDAERLHGLIDEVERRTPQDRRVRYVAVIALARPGRAVVTARGEVEGTLVWPQGSGGFGYDPAFFCPELGHTMARASAAEKDSVSHRGRAIRALLRQLDAEAIS